MVVSQISEAPPKILTNDEKTASTSADSAEVKTVRRRRKLLKPRKVSGEKTHAEGDPKISRGALVSTLKPRSAQPWRTVPCEQIKKRRCSAVRLRQIPSESGKGETCGHVDTKKVTPFERTPLDEGTSVYTQPESPSLTAAVN